MNISEMRGLQNSLIEDQISLADAIKKKELEELELVDIDYNLGFAIIDDILRVTLPEHPPKTSIYSPYTIEDGVVQNRAYQKARNRWYSLINEALEDYEGEGIDPAIVYIIYYVPRICNVGNFISRIIISGLMYAGAIGKDNNLKHVPSLVQEAYIDKENPRTEIYITKFENQIEKTLLP